MRKNRTLIVAGAAALALLAIERPSADFRIAAHDAGDPSPRQARAALDLGLMAVSIIVTWTGDRLAR